MPFLVLPETTQASAAPRNPKGLLKAGPHIREIRLCCRIQSKSIHGHLL
jgi:hypothetical protein